MLLCLLKSVGTIIMWENHRHEQLQEASAGKIFQSPIFDKRTEHPSWKVLLFLRHEFSCELDRSPYFKLYMKKDVLPTIVWCQGYWVSLHKLPSLVTFQTVAALKRCVHFTGVGVIVIPRFWCLPIDIDCVLFHVKIEDELYISVERNRATHYKKLELEVEKSTKNSQMNSAMDKIAMVKDLKHRASVHDSVCKITEVYIKDLKSWG